jgi:hypothetical protein
MYLSIVGLPPLVGHIYRRVVSYFSKEEKDRVLGSQEVINFLIIKFSQVNFASQRATKNPINSPVEIKIIPFPHSHFGGLPAAVCGF